MIDVLANDSEDDGFLLGIFREGGVESYEDYVE